MDGNVKRWSIIQSLKRKNLTLAGQIKVFTRTLTDSDKIAYMMKLQRKITACAGLSLYAEGADGTTGITGHMCGEKLCFVCNSQRARVTRRKYFRWFSENKTLREITVNGNAKVVTAFQHEKNYSSLPFKVVLYDVMHFTLTVPHSAGRGYRGKPLYYDEFTDNMTELRRLKFWKEMVLGGEYGIETERKEAGAHIHVHGLMLVRNARQNRNHLHRELLLAWNRLSVDPGNERNPLSDLEKAAVKRGNKLLTDADVDSLDPRGATFINLETIYTVNQDTKQKEHVTDFAGKKFMKGILEAIKYHFEPLFFDKGSKTFDLQMIADIKPLIAGKALYKKFGCLVGETSLNISEDIKVEYADAVNDVDQDTGEILERTFYLVNPALMYSNQERLIWSRQAVEKRQRIKAESTPQAVEYLAGLIKEAGKHGKLG